MTPIQAIRKHCLDCCCGRSQVVKFCTCDGLNSTRCHLWPYRFGMRPATAAKKYGEWLLDPNRMPSADVVQGGLEHRGVSQVVRYATRGEIESKKGTRLATGATPGSASGQSPTCSASAVTRAFVCEVADG